MNTQFLNDSLSRRRFLELSGKAIGFGALTASLSACGGGSGGSDQDDNPDPGTVLRIPPASVEYSILKRTSFGVSKASLAEIRQLGIDHYLTQQLNYETIDASAIESTIAVLFPLASQTPADLRPGFPDNIGLVAKDLVSATHYRAFFSPRQLYEVMVEFWSNHFSIHLLNGLEPVLKPMDDAQVIRPHALGNFKDLLYASAKSGAMMFYLDNFLNTAEAPNENYARELLELHTLGVDGGYTEQDIKEVAKCFTGWSLDFNTLEFAFVPLIHDTADKQILGQFIPGGGGIGDGETVLDIISSHPATATFIATKLCQRFISDSPATDTITTVAAAFSNSSGDIKATLSALFGTTAFLETSDQKLSRPLEFMGQIERALNPTMALPQDNGDLFYGVSAVLGQTPFFWPTPDGYPDESAYWGGTSGLLNRWRLALGISYGNYYPLTDLIDTENTSIAIIDRLVDEVLMRPMNDADRQLLIDWLAETIGLPADGEIPSAVIPQVLPIVVSLLLSSVYFQLR